MSALDPSMVDAGSMLGHVQQVIPDIVKLVNLLANIAGLVIVFLGLFKFTKVGDPVNQGGNPWIVPVMWIFMGSALLNLGSSLQSVLVTMFGSGVNVHHLLAYQAASDLPKTSQQLIATLVTCVRVYGFIAAIRGFMILRHVGDPTHQQNTPLKSGGMRVVFGCLLLNIVQSVNVAAATFGWGHPL